MKIRTIALATAALSLAASPAIAQAVFERATAPIEGESVDGNNTILFALLGGAAVIGGIIAASGGGDDEPTSP